MKIIGLIILMLVVLSVSVSCVNTNNPASSENTPIASNTNAFTPFTDSQLNKTSWALKLFRDGNTMTSLLGNRVISLRFGSNSTYYSGNIGTFSYGGQMSEQGDNLTIGLMTSTPIEIIDDPPGFRQQATIYLALIRSAKTYTIENGELLINCENGKSLIFSQTENPPFNT
jgi:heat shock protein HslJ